MGRLTSGSVIVLARLSFISPVSIARKYVQRMHSTLCANTGLPSTVQVVGRRRRRFGGVEGGIRGGGGGG